MFHHKDLAKIQKLCQLQVDKPDTNSAPKMTYLQIWSV